MISRRGYMAGSAALAALAGVFAPRRRARAAPLPYPKRLLIWAHQEGALRGALVPTGGETTFTFPMATQPLAPWRSRLLVLDGVHNTAGEQHLLGDTHEKAYSGLLTGKTLVPRIAPPLVAPSESLDQFLGRKLQGPTRLASIELTVEADAGAGPGITYPLGGGTQMPMVGKASQAFDRLFSGVVGSGSSTTDTEQARRLRSFRSSVLDHVGRDLAALAPRLGADDARKIAAHLDAVRELEKQLAAPLPAGGACRADRPPADVNPKDKTTIPAATKTMIDMIVQAFACDITRMITFSPSNAGQSGAPWLGEARDIHLVSHGKYGDWSDIGPRWMRWMYEQQAYLLQRLSEVPEGDGTLLDHTLILSIHDFGDSATHNFKNLFTVLIGDAGGYLRPGRLLTFGGKPHNNVLVTVANAMGVELRTFGEASLCDGGPLPAVRA
jgi:hypothetical protein